MTLTQCWQYYSKNVYLYRDDYFINLKVFCFQTSIEFDTILMCGRAKRLCPIYGSAERQRYTYKAKKVLPGQQISRIIPAGTDMYVIHNIDKSIAYTILQSFIFLENCNRFDMSNTPKL